MDLCHIEIVTSKKDVPLSEFELSLVPEPDNCVLLNMRLRRAILSACVDGLHWGCVLVVLVMLASFVGVSVMCVS